MSKIRKKHGKILRKKWPRYFSAHRAERYANTCDATRKVNISHDAIRRIPWWKFSCHRLTSEGKFGRIRKMAARTARGRFSRISPFRLKRAIPIRTSHSIHNSAVYCLNRKTGKTARIDLKIEKFCLHFDFVRQWDRLRHTLCRCGHTLCRCARAVPLLRQSLHVTMTSWCVVCRCVECDLNVAGVSSVAH
jgi:hypothetical protein